jgi:hypothetical protein
VNLCAPQRIHQFNPNGDDRNILQNITRLRLFLRGGTGYAAPQSLREGPLRGETLPKHVDFPENATVLTRWPLRSTQDITPLTLRDDGRNGPPPLLTPRGAAGAWGSRGTKVILDLPILALVALAVSRRIGVMRASPDELEGVMAGLVLACPGYPRGSEHRKFVSAARAKALCLQNFAAGRPMSAPSLKRCPRGWPGQAHGCPVHFSCTNATALILLALVRVTANRSMNEDHRRGAP